MTTYFNQHFSVETRQISDYTIKGISLGERGRGRYELFIPCSESSPESFSGVIPGIKLGTTKSNRPRLIPGDDKEGISLVLSAEGGYRRGTWGFIKYLKGSEVELLGVANGAFGDAGRIGSWDAVACKLKSGWICIHRSGHNDASEYVGFGPDGKFHNTDCLDDLICLYDMNGWDLPFTLTDERLRVKEEWESVTSLPLPEFTKKPAEK